MGLLATLRKYILTEVPQDELRGDPLPVPGQHLLHAQLGLLPQVLRARPELLGRRHGGLSRILRGNISY